MHATTLSLLSFPTSSSRTPSSTSMPVFLNPSSSGSHFPFLAPAAVFASMDSEVTVDLSPMLKIYRDGHVERLMNEDVVSPSLEPLSGVVSKDILFSPQHKLSVRMFTPGNALLGSDHKLPLLVYFHGGAFMVGSPFCESIHKYLIAVCSSAKCAAVAVQYRRAPENPIPAAYEDSWSAIRWVAAHCRGDGQDDWLNKFVDFNRVFFAGDSAGANIVHHMAMRIGEEKPSETCFNLSGIILVHPFFWGKEPIDNKETRDPSICSRIEALWALGSPSNRNGVDDPWINVFRKDPSLAGIACGRVLVCVAELDVLARRGWAYAQRLRESGWDGQVAVMEAKGEHHVFHFAKPSCEGAVAMMEKLVEFMTTV